jgi:ABC-type multidrug transport system ATPase subunit
MLEVRELSVLEHGNIVVGDITLEIKRGEAVAIIGPNYSGKSTLLRAIAGGFRHFEGDCRISSYSLTQDPKHYKSQLGYAAPVNQPDPFLTGLEWLEIVGTAYSLSPKKRITAILQLADLLDVKEELYRTVEHISLAAKQKISLIGSLFHNPTVALWDEPTQFLDPLAQEALAQIVRTTTSANGAVLFASNHLEWAERVADRYIFLENGQIIGEGTLAHLRNTFRADERNLTTVFRSAFND